MTSSGPRPSTRRCWGWQACGCRTAGACFDPRADGEGYDARPNPEWLYFAVDDVDAAYRACRAAGGAMSGDDVHGTPGGEVAVRPWGERSFYATDPFGNRVCFVASETAYRGA